MANLDLAIVKPHLREEAIRAFSNGDATKFVSLVGNMQALLLVYYNHLPLRERGIYEPSLIEAFTGAATNNSSVQEDVIEILFRRADRDKLRAAGDPVPDAPVVAYRGIAGNGRRRRKRGWSWTESLDVACWFACRLGLAKPAILKAILDPQEILACINHRDEQEFIVRPRSFTRLQIDSAEIERRAAQHFERRNAQRNTPVG